MYSLSSQQSLSVCEYSLVRTQRRIWVLLTKIGLCCLALSIRYTVLQFSYRLCCSFVVYKLGVVHYFKKGEGAKRGNQCVLFTTVFKKHDLRARINLKHFWYCIWVGTKYAYILNKNRKLGETRGFRVRTNLKNLLFGSVNLFKRIWILFAKHQCVNRRIFVKYYCRATFFLRNTLQLFDRMPICCYKHIKTLQILKFCRFLPGFVWCEYQAE